MTIKIVYVILFGVVYMKPAKIFMNLSVIVLFVSLIISSAPFTALAQSSPEIFNPLEVNSFSLDGVAANFADVAMPKANPAYNGFIVPPNHHSIPSGAIHIQTAQQLAGIGGAQSAGKYYVLDNDIDLVGEWVPIDDFRGTLDGYGHRVNNLYVLENSNRQYAGLFGQIDIAGVVIKNVAINTGPNGITVVSTSTFVCAGGLVGISSAGVVVENCFVVGDVSVSSSWAYLGGLVGCGGGDVVVENCYVEGGVSGDMTVLGFYHGVCVGGLVGYSFGGGVVVVENCFVVGDVSVSASAYSGFVCAGGLVGQSAEGDVVVENCFVEGNVTASDDNGSDVCAGGLIGYSYGGVFVENCYVVGDVVASGSVSSNYGYGCAGGLVGYVAIGDVFVVDCFVVGDITAFCSSKYGGSSGAVCVGGLVGRSYIGSVFVVDCFVVGDVSSVVFGSGYAVNVYVGGLVGYGEYMSIENCYVSGDITGYSDYGDSFDHVTVGGLIGHSTEGVIVENCFVVGSVSGSVSDVSVYGPILGGLVGSSYGEVHLVNCYVTCNVFCVLSYGHAGDLIGFSSSVVTVESCYRLSTQQISGLFTSLLGVPLSVEAMQKRESFVGWDFANTWAINPDVNRGFPYLRNLFGEQPEKTPEIQISSATGKAGDEVTLIVSLVNNPGIASYSLTIKYPSELEYVHALQGDILDSNFFVTTSGVGQISVSANSATGADVSTGTVLFTITFKIGNGVEAGTIIDETTGLVLGIFRSIDAVESDGERVSCVFNQGQIVVLKVFYGDVNGDGFVDFLDVTRLLRYSSLTFC
jgi:hypothetical protein